MSNIIIGTAGHIDHGKTSLIKALNGFEGDQTKEEKQRGITIDLSFSNLKRVNQNIAFIDVPGHEKLVKNMIAGAFGFDIVMLVIASNEGIMPQTLEHIQIINLLGIKDIIVVLTKKDLVTSLDLETLKYEIQSCLDEFELNTIFTHEFSIYDKNSIEKLKDKLFSLNTSKKEQENFFRFYVDRVFSPKGIGTVVTGTVLGDEIKLEDKLFICDIQKESKIKNIQVHNSNCIKADISNRAALNLSGVNAKDIQRGFLISKKGFLRGFSEIDISFKSLKEKRLFHNRNYQLYIGSRRIEVKVLLYTNQESLENGFATIKSNEKIYSIFGEKLILRTSNETIAGGIVLNPISDPIKKVQKIELLKYLEERNIAKAYKLLVNIHKKGFGLISSAQRFALSHENALNFGDSLKDVYIDKKSLVIYPNSTKELIKNSIKDIYIKNSYALLSANSLGLRLKWASISFIEEVLTELCFDKFLIKEESLYKNANISEDISSKLEEIILSRLYNEEFMPTAPYNIYDDLDIDRKLGDKIFKSLCSKKSIIRLQHNLFIHSQNLVKIMQIIKEIIKTNTYIDIHLFKEFLPISRKYLIAYLDYADNFGEIEKVGEKRVIKRKDP